MKPITLVVRCSFQILKSWPSLVCWILSFTIHLYAEFTMQYLKQIEAVVWQCSLLISIIIVLVFEISSYSIVAYMAVLLYATMTVQNRVILLSLWIKMAIYWLLYFYILILLWNNCFWAHLNSTFSCCSLNI